MHSNLTQASAEAAVDVTTLPRYLDQKERFDSIRFQLHFQLQPKTSSLPSSFQTAQFLIQSTNQI